MSWRVAQPVILSTNSGLSETGLNDWLFGTAIHSRLELSQTRYRSGNATNSLSLAAKTLPCSYILFPANALAYSRRASASTERPMSREVG
jgi:hypothetical protein